MNDYRSDRRHKEPDIRASSLTAGVQDHLYTQVDSQKEMNLSWQTTAR